MFDLPPGFISLHDAYDTVGSDKFCNIIAVVVDCLPPAKSRRDWMVKIALSDHTYSSGVGAPFRFFNSNGQGLPPFSSRCYNGDVVIIRKMKVKDFGGVVGLTNRYTEWTVVNGSSLVASPKDQLESVATIRSATTKLGPPTTAELLYAREILETIDRSTIRSLILPTSLTTVDKERTSGEAAVQPKDRFTLIKDIVPPSDGNKIFKDLLGEVRRIYKTDSRMSIYVTDYTSHDLLYDYRCGHDDEMPDGDRFGYVQQTTKGWPGPQGKKTILITLWDAHAVFAHRELHEGNYVLLKNVHLTMDRNGSLLEGHCRGDKLNMSKVNISIVKPTEVESNRQLRDLLRRKQAIEKAESATFIRDPTTLKRKAELTAEVVNNTTVTSRGSKNKKRREKRRKGNAKGVGTIDHLNGNGPESNSEVASLFSVNTEVRTFNIAVPCKPIHEIFDPDILIRKTEKGNTYHLPFQNCRYRLHVRVVDFFPNEIADFAVPTDYDGLSDEEDSESNFGMTQMNATDAKWEWRFFLVVEDIDRAPGQQPVRMELLVSDVEGDYLLNMEACDLRKNSRDLTRVKEKLFVIWGDLQELKEEAGSSQAAPEFKPRARPFECLVTEYGIEARDEDGMRKRTGEYERMFRLCGTTVK